MVGTRCDGGDERMKNNQRIVVIGASLGGLHALRTLFAQLRADFPHPIVVVQHRHKERSNLLLLALAENNSLPVVEITDKLALQRGVVHLAPADYHVLVEQQHLALSLEAPVIYARPSIDVLFESTALAYGSRTIGVVLTGASHDGAAGIRAIKQRGGITLVQDPTTAECAIMPQAAIAATTIDYVLSLDAIAATLANELHLTGL